MFVQDKTNPFWAPFMLLNCELFTMQIPIIMPYAYDADPLLQKEDLNTCGKMIMGLLYTFTFMTKYT